MPTISIIIPLYNAEKYITTCLESIKIQKYNNFEVIIINDASKDNSAEIVNQFSQKNPDFPLKFIQNEINLGLSVTRNKGIDIAQSDYIFFMDNDDTLFDENTLGYFIEKTTEKPDIIIGQTKLIQNNIPTESSYHRLKNTKAVYEKQEIFEAFLKGEWAVTAWNKLYKTDFLIQNQLKFLDNLLHEDELWAFETAIAAKKVCFLEHITYEYHSLLNPQSMTATMALENIEHYLKIIKHKLKIAAEKNLFTHYPQLIIYLKNFSNYSILSRVCTNEFSVFKRFYNKLNEYFVEYTPNQSEFSLHPRLAFLLYKMKFDTHFILFAKLPKYVNKFLKI